jgi:hypothetical protein
MEKKKTRVLPETLIARSEEKLRAKEIEYGGMLAISIIAFQVILSATAIDWSVAWALDLFAIAAPLLANVFVAKAHRNNINKWTELCGDIGEAFAGIGSFILLSHFSGEAGVLFLLVGLPAYFYGKGDVIEVLGNGLFYLR